MTWFAFAGLNGGQAIDLAGVQEKDAAATGFHGYATQAQAQASPNSVNAVTRVEADALIADYKAAVAEQAQPGGKNASNPVAAGAQAVETGAKDAASTIASDTGVNAIGDFFSTLTEKNVWVRAAKVIVGSVMIIVGLARITGAGNAVTAVAKEAIP